MWLRILFSLLVMLTLAAPAMSAPAERVALVIGAGKYQNTVTLANPPNDAKLISAVLEKLNFSVKTVVDPDYDSMKRALRDFSERLDGAKVGLFYYAGHGLQVAGRNYAMPIDAAIDREADLTYGAFDIQTVIDQMSSPNRVSLVFLDACRDNPFGRSLASGSGARSTSVGRGLAEMGKGNSGTFIAYATAADQIAQDGDGENSPFSVAVAKHILTPGLEINSMMIRVRTDVKQATGGHQQPWVNGSMDAEFFFAPLGGLPPKPYEALVEPAMRPAIMADEAAWSTDQLHAVQNALVLLGHHRGAREAAVGPILHQAVKRWQAFEELDETGALTTVQRVRLLDEAAVVSSLLRKGAVSPRGVAADSVKGAQARFYRAADSEFSQAQPKDPVEAAYWYALAAADGWPAAFTNLGTIVARGQGGSKADLVAARRLWLVAAALGDGTALFNLGVMAEKGIGVAIDPHAAKTWFTRGAVVQNVASRTALKRVGG